MQEKLLVADAPEFRARLAAVLAPREARFVHSLDAATRLLAEDDFAAVLIGLHFDESRMFDLLRAIRAGSRNRDVPVLCYRLRPLAFAAPGSEALDVAVQALGARAFIDAASRPAEVGDRLLAAYVASLTARG
jgi:DNA-binding response OmpR family regulator